MAENKLRSLWEQRLAEHKASGKTIRDWCIENSISESRFYYWRRELQEFNAGSAEKPQWLPLKAKDNPSNSTITIHIGQVKIEISKGFDQYLLREIVQVLQSTK